MFMLSKVFVLACFWMEAVFAWDFPDFKFAVRYSDPLHDHDPLTMPPLLGVNAFHVIDGKSSAHFEVEELAYGATSEAVSFGAW
eukprot:CAMPEP_0197622664 /NCGR_PEP_ID=MMETSP1338-20131121/2872_1 /TAXON_ID=43686 ORGANISM="Pelagodinium beii, Strain RCC1491" /NCGR_SAMPLE_ID=MMETSP1338 /ASSEMBLY_ACC=CAM_ASM_000754 /LENGTH=83 /DNA_ID=CAMNT_0043192411 /DNA_START=78 /DNA_END=326 /DNA_ORIENTATION=+